MRQWLGLICIILWVGVGQAEPPKIAAAASLKPAFEAFHTEYTARTGKTIHIAYAGSSQLARQIEYGAEYDLFISANTKWVEYLSDLDVIDHKSIKPWLTNRLYLVAVQDAVDASLDDSLIQALESEYLAMGFVEAVPVGIYGRQALEHLGLWENLRSNVVQTLNARSNLALLATGQADYAIVYKTDFQGSEGLKKLAEFPAQSHDPIIYPIARIHQNQDGPDAEVAALLNALSADYTKTIFQSYGFGIIK